MKPSQVLGKREKESLDYETVVDCHFITPPPGKKDNTIICYCRKCKEPIIQFDQDTYDEKFVHMVTQERSQAHQEMMQAWLEHECVGMKRND